MTSITYFTTTGGEVTQFPEVLRLLTERGCSLSVACRTSLQTQDAAGAREFVATALASDAIVLSLHGGLNSCPAWDLLAEGLDARAPEGRPWLHIQASDDDGDAILAAQERCPGFADGTWGAVSALIGEGGHENLASALELVARASRGEEAAEGAPRTVERLPGDGLYLPEVGRLDDPMSFVRSLDPGRPAVAVVFPQPYWIQRNLLHVDAMIDALRRQGVQAVGLFSHMFRDDLRGYAGLGGVLHRYFRPNGRTTIDVLISMQGFSITTLDPSMRSVYPELGVPVLQAMTCSSTRAAWEATYQGLPTIDVSVQAAQPEFDGNLITRVVATRECEQIDPATGGLVTRYVPLPDRVESMADLAHAWARLRHLPVSERRVAIIFHHHPPRNDRIGCAAGLDTFESIRLLLRRMEEMGYHVPEQFESGDALAQVLLDGLTCDQRWLTPDQMHARAEAHLDAATARAWNADLPSRTRAALADAWGDPPGTLFVHHGESSFAGHLDGNVFLTIQPPRGEFEEMDEASIHDEILPPPHHYLNHYRWIRDVFGAHVVIHVGTHGSLEWLPGKALGMSEECYPEMVLADLPNIYPYIVNNPGEGTQAKRRSAAVAIDHLTPPLRNADLDDETAPVDRLCHEYVEAKAQTGGGADAVARTLWDAVKQADLDVDLGLTRDEALADPDGFVDATRHYLLELSDNAISDGLHILGTVATARGEDAAEDVWGARERVVAYLVQLLRLPNGEIPSLRESVLEAWGTSLAEATEAGSRGVPGTAGTSGIDLIRRAHETCLALVDRVADEAMGRQPRRADSAAQATKEVMGAEHPAVVRVLDFLLDDLGPRLGQVSDEVDSVLGAMAGGFVPPGPSGAPSRGNVSILPTGRNFYSLDPRTLPTPAAWSVGVALGEALLQRYATDHPDEPYPRNIGIILWGTANMRSRGEDIAEILWLWGLRPRWASSGNVVGLDIVPAHELGRPRIDVTPRISGFFRDAFPNLVELLDEAAGLVAALDEPEGANYLRAHVLTDLAQATEQGLDAEEAWRLCTLRVFGCPPGTYAAGVEELVETKRWSTKEDLGAAYIQASAHAYGQGVYGEVRVDAFRNQLARMDATVKNEDTREYDMMSCTDFYNYYGGLIAAATTVRGSAPASFVGDSSDPRQAKNRTTSEEARLVIRSRILNPAWIEGLQRHGYKGAGDLSKVLDILVGWEATADVVDDVLWDRVARTYALDPSMQDWLRDTNPYALTNIIDKLLDMAQRGLWNADDQMRRDLEDAYLAAEADVEEAVDLGEQAYV